MAQEPHFDHSQHSHTDDHTRPGHPAERQCGWCGATFAVVRRPGRPLIYCRRSCRQRAYERRRGLGVLPPPDRIITQEGGPLAHLRPWPGQYEGGQLLAGPGRVHAMRPAGIADERGRRLTLCGLLVPPVAYPFSGTRASACQTCDAVSRVRVSARPIRLSHDLAALRAIIDAASVEFSRRPSSEHRVRGSDEILADLLLAV